MSVNISPGTQINIKVIKTPTNEAAAKTLSRIFAKGPGARKLRETRKALRSNAMDVRRRGGRPWEVRQKAPRLFMPQKGDACSVRATCALLGDLRSVASFVEVASAK